MSEYDIPDFSDIIEIYHKLEKISEKYNTFPLNEKVTALKFEIWRYVNDRMREYVRVIGSKMMAGEGVEFKL